MGKGIVARHDPFFFRPLDDLQHDDAGVFGLVSGSTWIEIMMPSMPSLRAFSMRSQMSWASDTLSEPGTTRWNSTKVLRPDWRVLTSCASMAPSALTEMMSRMRLSCSSGTATSISPPTLSETSL